MSAVEVDTEQECPVVRRGVEELQALGWAVECPMTSVEIDSLENPWVAAVAMLTPFQYANQSMRRLAPDESLGIEWIYGYQGLKCRNNVRYNFQGDLVYTVSKYAVVYSFVKHEQVVFSGHEEEDL